MNEERRNRLIWGFVLLIGALGCASLRNNPDIGISPLTVGIIEGMIYACVLMAARLSDWRMAALIALTLPVYLWTQRFLDGFMIPVDMLVNLTLIGCMRLAMKKGWRYAANVAVLTIPAFAAMLIAGAAAVCIVKQESVLRSLIVAWNTDVYSLLSILGAALVCAPYTKKAR